MLDARYGAEGGIKDWIDIDPNAVDRRGRPIYACDSPTSCRSDLANYIELPVGTSDVEVYLAFGGMSKILGGLWKGLGRLLAAEGGAEVAAAERAALMNGVTENGATIRYSDTATAIGDDVDTLQNFARSRALQSVSQLLDDS